MALDPTSIRGAGFSSQMVRLPGLVNALWVATTRRERTTSRSFEDHVGREARLSSSYSCSFGNTSEYGSALRCSIVHSDVCNASPSLAHNGCNGTDEWSCAYYHFHVRLRHRLPRDSRNVASSHDSRRFDGLCPRRRRLGGTACVRPHDFRARVRLESTRGSIRNCWRSFGRSLNGQMHSFRGSTSHRRRPRCR